MKRFIKFFVLSLVLISNSYVYGYICLNSSGFNIYDFDKALSIVEVKVIYSNDEIISVIENDPLFEERKKIYYCKVLKSYKNNFFEDSIAITMELGYGASWIPEEGETHIIYLDNPCGYLSTGRNIYEVGDCHKFLEERTNAYREHRAAMKVISDSKSDKFTLFTYIEEWKQGLKLMSGKFKKGKRHGRWHIYVPFINSFSEALPNEKVAIVIVYRQGKIIRVNSKMDGNETKPFTEQWYKWYLYQAYK